MSIPLYHMDLVGSVVSLSGQWAIYKKHWWGWALCAVGNGVFLYVNASAGLWGMWPISIFAMCISLWSASHWRKASHFSG